MRVLLAGPDYEENLSIRYLSSSLMAAGHDTELAAFNSPSDILPVASQSEGAEVVGLSMCFQSRAREFLHLARVVKACDPKKLVVAGGHYASCAAEPLLANHPELDVIVIHEGERTLVEIANAAADLKTRLPEIAGIAYRQGSKVRFTRQRRTLDDLDALPFPDRRGPIHSIAGVPTSYMMGSRGCYGSCAYCCITTLHQITPGKRFRQRKAERIADEMAALYHERGTRQFVFHDDNFLVPSEAINHARISAFEKAWESRGVKDIALVIKCRPTDANRTVLGRLKDLGLVRVFLGIESATEQGLSSLERKQSVDDSVRALETCAALGISAQFTLMTFHPDATLETLRADIAFMRRFRGNPLNFCRAEIYAGTPLERRMIELGRTRGDYLAREYSLADPVAQLASNAALELFHDRCWGNGSLMQRSIGLDHTAAVARRMYRRPKATAICGRVGNWLQVVNLDTVDLLEEIIELSAAAAGSKEDTGFQNALRQVSERESKTRRALLSEGEKLNAELESLRFADDPNRPGNVSSSRLRLARQAAAALLAVGIPVTSACGSPQGKDATAPPKTPDGDQYYGISEMAAIPLQTQPAAASAFTGTVKDPSGAVIANATVRVMNAETGIEIRSARTNPAGQYVIGDLPAGVYNVAAEATGFSADLKPKVDLKAGQSKQVDFALQVSSNIGCCEYAAAPLNVPEEDWTAKRKPFTYTVGLGKDENSFQGIAKLVYGDRNMWVQIFEANRDVMQKPGFIPYGTGILIPRNKRVVPKLISKVLPTYPAEAKQEHVWGEVVMDVTLKEDGSVDQVSVIDGPPPLVNAATTAVKEWRYRPLAVKGKPVDKFVVVVSFGKNGKVH